MISIALIWNFLYTDRYFVLFFLSIFSDIFFCIINTQLRSLSYKYQSLDVRYLDSLWFRMLAKSRSRLRYGESMRARSVSLSPILVSENFPVMSFVGRFPSRTEKLNAKVLSDIQYLCAPEKKGVYAHGYIRIVCVIIVICFTIFLL